MNCLRVTFFCHLIDLRTARITKPDRSCHLVKCLSCRIITGFTDDLILSVIFYDNKMRMSARYHKAGKRRLQFLMFNKIGADMSFDMMHSDKWLIRCKCDRFCFRYPDKKCTNQPRSICNCNGSHIIQCHVSIRKRLV